MQNALIDSLVADSVVQESLRLDSLRADSISALEAARDTSTAVIDTTRGVGRLGREVGAAATDLAAGRWESALETLGEALITFLVSNLLPAVAIAVAFWVALRIVQRVVGSALNRSHRVDAGVRQLILRVLRFSFIAFGTVVVLAEVGLAVAPLIAGLGIAGIAIGFAAQDTVQNLIAGVTILLDRPFQVGDNIELDDTFGTVEEITLRTTRIRTLDNQMAILPNANVISNKILNHSMLRALRIVVPFGIAYKESPEAARQAVLALTVDDGRLHPDYASTAVVTSLGDSSVDMELRLHLRDPKLEVPIKLEYQEKVFEALREAEIEIPFPHLQLFIDEAKAFQDSRLLGPGPETSSE